MKHWAAGYIAKPWAAGATGPDAYDCRGLVRCLVRQRLGVELPEPEVARAWGWRAVKGPPQVDDVLLMRGPAGRHVGYMVEANGRLGVLHANGTAARPGGSVMFQSLDEVLADGYGDHEIWRFFG